MSRVWQLHERFMVLNYEKKEKQIIFLSKEGDLGL